MHSMETKIFNLDGQKLRFDARTFEYSFRAYAQDSKMKKKDLEELLAEKVGVSREAVHNWRFAKNGPSDIEMIQKLAEVLNIKEWRVFTKSASGGEMVVQLTERQKDACKRVYDSIVEFLFEFKQTSGFNDYWFQYSSSEEKNVENMIYGRVEEKVDHLFLVLDKEYFDLGKHEIYEKLCEYVSENIYDLFDGKLSYAYRFEAAASGNLTTLEDYDHAMKALNEIIEEYI